MYSPRYWLSWTWVVVAGAARRDDASTAASRSCWKRALIARSVASEAVSWASEAFAARSSLRRCSVSVVVVAEVTRPCQWAGRREWGRIAHRGKVLEGRLSFRGRGVAMSICGSGDGERGGEEESGVGLMRLPGALAHYFPS